MQKHLLTLGMLTLVVLPIRGGAAPAPRPEPYFAPGDANAPRIVAMFAEEAPKGSWMRFHIQRSDATSGQPLPSPSWQPLPKYPAPMYPEPRLPEPELLPQTQPENVVPAAWTPCFRPVGVGAYDLQRPHYVSEPRFKEASVRELLTGKVTKGIRTVQDISIGGRIFTRYSFTASPEPGLSVGYEVSIDKDSPVLPELLEKFLDSFTYLNPPSGRSQEEGFAPVLLPQSPPFSA